MSASEFAVFVLDAVAKRSFKRLGALDVLVEQVDLKRHRSSEVARFDRRKAASRRFVGLRAIGGIVVKFKHSVDNDTCGQLFREAKDSAGDERNGDRLQAESASSAQHIEDGATQQIVARRRAIIDRTNNVNDMLGRQSASTGDSSVRDRQRTKLPHVRVALLLHDGAAKANKRVRNAATVCEVLVGGIDGGVDAAQHHVAVKSADSSSHTDAEVAVFVCIESEWRCFQWCC